MKGSFFAKILLFSVILVSSCSREDISAGGSIVGRWQSVSVFQQDNGRFNWVQFDGFQEILTLNADARFSIFTDVPGGQGVYDFDPSAQNITFRYQDQAGNPVGTESRKVESISASRMVVAYFTPQGELLNKMEYTRID